MDARWHGLCLFRLRGKFLPVAPHRQAAMSPVDTAPRYWWPVGVSKTPRRDSLTQETWPVNEYAAELLGLPSP